MSWGAHPDTLCIASAQGAADRSGQKANTIAWLKVYRDHYAKIAGDERDAAEYIRKLDEKIAAGNEPVWLF